MGLRQVLRQLEYIAKNMKWKDATRKSVFGDSLDTVAEAGDLLNSLRIPFILFKLSSTTMHEENPSLKEAQIEAVIVTMHQNDRFGRMCLLGGHQRFALSTGSSYFKGLLEIQEEFYQQMASLSRQNGI